MNEFRIGRRKKCIDEPQENLLERRRTKQPSPPATVHRQFTATEQKRIAKQVAEIKKGTDEIGTLLEQAIERIKKHPW